MTFGKDSDYSEVMANPFNTRWSANFAYAIGLITSDGCLSKDGRHIDFTSKDLDQIQTFMKILNLKNKVGLKYSGHSNKKYFRIQIGNVKFYRFLLTIGLTPAKSKTLGELKIPKRFFIDFLRGCLDGDGYTFSYWDPRWKSSFMLYTGLVSASKVFLDWIYKEIDIKYRLKGKITPTNGAYQLRYAKVASIKLLSKIYYKKDLFCLKRKYLKIQTALGYNRLSSRGAEIGKQTTLRW